MKKSVLLIAACCLSLAATVAQSTKTSARAGIGAGNQAWIDGVKNGDVALIIATYAEMLLTVTLRASAFGGALKLSAI
jgi:hypothetical protein